MGIDKGIDPYAGEYLPSRINHLGNAVYIRLATPLGSWWADTSIGSRLHELSLTALMEPAMFTPNGATLGGDSGVRTHRKVRCFPPHRQRGF